MHNGFYAELNKLCEENPGSDFCFMENGLRYRDLTPYDFLHGHCAEFARYLNEKYGYRVEAVWQEPSQLIHAYCVTKYCGKTLYVDIRGFTDSYDELMKEFYDSGLWADDGYTYTLKYDASLPENFGDYNKALSAAEVMDNEYMYYDSVELEWLCGRAALARRNQMKDTKYVIRVFNERFNMDPDYYGGRDDVRLERACKSAKELLKAWQELLKDNEGETYAVEDLKKGRLITGGAYDPGDIEYIRGYLSQLSKPA